ncbi:MAG TPA: TetR/AcrR family transcriptional regulator [Vicinamibacteria bacterium]|nr:TetR/AcrR family transcriptional regulator [Vicinamibacteria bacterium]
MPQSRRERERASRRESLLDAAARVFGRKPFDEASMQEVATEADIGMQGLYEHFPSKQELYEQVIARRAVAFQQRAVEALSRPGSALDHLRALGLAYVEQFREQPWHFPPFARDRVNFDWDVDSRFAPRLREIYRAERANVRRLMVEAIEAGEVQPLDADFLTQLCLDVLQASLHYSHHGRPDEPADECVDRALACILRGVGTRR